MMTLKLTSKRRSQDVVETRISMGMQPDQLEVVGVIVTDVGQWQLFGAALLLASRQMKGHLVVVTEGDEEVVGFDGAG